MFYSYKHPSVRYTGRFSELNGAMTTTAPGSVIEIAYTGEALVLQFDTENNPSPVPHLWLQLDGGIKTEVPLDKYLRVEANFGQHILTIIYKGGREMFNRFYHPLEGKISFAGFYAQGCADLPADNRKTIEIIGDSITEGVLVDEFLRADNANDQNNRPLQDDVTATYGWLIAERLSLRPLYMGYGAVGLTRSGCGGYPKAADGYEYCFEGAKTAYGHPDYILINHGANDRGAGEEKYLYEYRAFLDKLTLIHPNAVIICLSSFVGFCSDGLSRLVKTYNSEHGTNIYFVDGSGIIPKEPLHPLRGGHKQLADALTDKIREITENN